MQHFELKWHEFESISWVPLDAAKEPELDEGLRHAAALAFVALKGCSYGRCDFRVDSQGGSTRTTQTHTHTHADKHTHTRTTQTHTNTHTRAHEPTYVARSDMRTCRCAWCADFHPVDHACPCVCES